MKRPLFVIGTAFACTTWLAFLFSHTGALLLSGVCAATGALFLALKRPGLQIVSLIFLTAALALACYALHRMWAVLPFHRVEGQVLEIQGMVLEQSGTGYNTRYTLRADFIGNPELPQGQTVVLRSYGGVSCEPGDTIRFLGKVSLPERTASARYYRSRGIALIADMRGTACPVPQEGFQPQRALLQLRSRMQNGLDRTLSPENAAVAAAMVLGLTDNVSAETYTAVSRSGTVHLLAVSGLHLSIVTAFVLAALKKLHLPRRPRCLLAIASALLFAGLVGFSASVMRAFLMTSLMLLARCFSRRSDSRNALGLALLLICLARPHWILGRSLWLSAASTLGILRFAPPALKWLHKRISTRRTLAGRFLHTMLGAGVVSLCAYVFSLPILLVSTGWFSLVSPLANMLVAPFVTLMILGSIFCALGFPPFLGAVSALTDFCVDMVLGISRVLAAVPVAVFSLDEGYLLILAAGAALGLLFLLMIRADKQLAAFGALLLLVCYSGGTLSHLHANRDVVELAVIEGCAAVVLIRQDQAVILGSPTRFSVSRLIRYLDFRGVRRIGALVATDYPDRVDSGLLRLSNRYGVDCVIGPDDAYILGQLEAALPGTPVFSGGYATTHALDGIQITTYAHTSDIKVETRDTTILKTDQKYAIIAEYEEYVLLFGDGSLHLPGAVHPVVEPMGRHLFGEVRLLLGARNQT